MGKKIKKEKYRKAFRKALKVASNFEKRYKALTQMCSECHTNKVVEDVYFGKEINK